MNDIKRNANGVAQYPKGHVGRLLVVLAAIQSLDRPTVQSIADYTGLSKGNIDYYVAQLRDELGALICKDGPVFVLDDLGPVVKISGLKKALEGTIKQDDTGPG